MARLNPFYTVTNGSVLATHDSNNYEAVSYVCKGLGAAESITIEFGFGSSWETLRDIDGNAITFTGSGGSPANRNSFVLDPAGLNLRFTGTVAGTIELAAIAGRGVNS